MLTEATERNLARKAFVVDRVQMRDGVPMFSWLDLSLTELCNRSAGAKKACVFCPRIDPGIYPNQKLHLSLDLARKIGDELRALDYQGAVVLCGFGEPLLHPQVVEVVRSLGGSASSPTIRGAERSEETSTGQMAGEDARPPRKIEVVTNGDRLTPDLVRELVDAGVSYFVVSAYDGPEQLQHFDALFAAAGCRNYIVRDRWHGPDQDWGLKLTNRAGTVSIGHQDAVTLQAPCHYTAYQLTIDWNGDALLCVQDWNKRVRFGNVHAQSLWEIWTSPALNKRRMRLIRGDRGDAPCSGCNAAGVLHGAAHAAAWAPGVRNQ